MSRKISSAVDQCVKDYKYTFFWYILSEETSKCLNIENLWSYLTIVKYHGKLAYVMFWCILVNEPNCVFTLLDARQIQIPIENVKYGIMYGSVPILILASATVIVNTSKFWAAYFVLCRKFKCFFFKKKY